MCCDRLYICCICRVKDCEFWCDPYNYDIPPVEDGFLDCLGSK